VFVPDLLGTAALLWFCWQLSVCYRSYAISDFTALQTLVATLKAFDTFRYVTLVSCAIAIGVAVLAALNGTRLGYAALLCGLGLALVVGILTPPTVLILGWSSRETAQIQNEVSGVIFPLRTVHMLSVSATGWDPLNNLRGERWTQRLASLIELCPIIVINSHYPEKFSSFGNVRTEWRLLQACKAWRKVIILGSRDSLGLGSTLAREYGGDLVTVRRSVATAVRIRLVKHKLARNGGSGMNARIN
jgi:hypothetical protein